MPDIPFLNRYINRRPTYELSRNVSRLTEVTEPGALSRQVSRVATRKPVPPTPRPPQVPPKDDQETEEAIDLHDLRLGDDLHRRASITSHVAEDHYAVLPHGVTLEDWSQEDVDALDDYVRHMLHSRRNRFKRGMMGFGKYIRKRKSTSLSTSVPANIPSSWFFRYTIRILNYDFWSNLGSLLDWVDLCWRAKRLHCQCHRQCIGRTLCNYG